MLMKLRFIFSEITKVTLLSWSDYVSDLYQLFSCIVSAKDHIPEMVFDRLKDNTCMYLCVDKMLLEMIRKRSVDW